MRAAEVAGVRQVWMGQPPTGPDTLTVLAAAAVRTTTIRLGTAIVPTYPRHPLALAQQALALFDLAPERLRLGVGPSHLPFIEGIYGLPMPSPLAHLREYVTVLRAALWQGQVHHQGRFYQVQASLPRTPRTPILISALREKSFHLAGELADGAISWMCPVPYLLEKALPALQAGAAKSGRPRRASSWGHLDGSHSLRRCSPRRAFPSRPMGRWLMPCWRAWSSSAMRPPSRHVWPTSWRRDWMKCT